MTATYANPFLGRMTSEQVLAAAFVDTLRDPDRPLLTPAEDPEHIEADPAWEVGMLLVGVAGRLGWTPPANQAADGTANR